MTRDVKPLEQVDYEKRLARARRVMEEKGIDGLLLTGATNMSYFLNMSWWRSERLFGAIINTQGDPIWVCPAFEAERAREVIRFGTDIRTWEENESPYDLVAGIMSDLKGRTLAIGPTVRNFVVEGIRNSRKGYGLNLVDGAVVTDACRGIKTEKELAFMDLANRITKLAYREGFSKLEKGMTTADLGQHIRAAHSAMGTNGGGGPLFGPLSAFPHGSRERRDLHDGDIILVDGGCSIEGYRSDVTRTIVFGTPTDKQKRVFDAVLKAQQSAMKAVRPGVACEEIDRVARKVIEDSGFGPGYQYFAHRLGHGIGMEGHEYPYLVQGNPLKLQPGMTFSNEPGIYIYGEFGVRIEDCFAVTDDGGKYLGGMLTTAIDHPFDEA
jgi:Xaa-Pro dipeptidase